MREGGDEIVYLRLCGSGAGELHLGELGQVGKKLPLGGVGTGQGDGLGIVGILPAAQKDAVAHLALGVPGLEIHKAVIVPAA